MMTPQVNAASVQQVLDDNPNLNADGWDAPSARDPHVATTRRSELVSDSGLAEIRAAVAYLASFEIQPRENKQTVSSYTLKHRAEEQIGYVTNGAFIVAALLLGIPLKVRPASQNPILLASPPVVT